ncbi:MAG: AsmA family protein, partial [Halioglobus sp.]|nr:AsmA family protein [Halioglobus sp.]
MSRLFKTLALAIAGIVLLIVLSAAALLLFFDPNNYKDEIAARVETATGRSLTIEGDLSFSVFPWLAVEMGKARLGNAAGFGDEPFISFDSAHLSVRLMPLLLRREIAVGTASLESLRVNLAVNAEGATNWQDLAENEARDSDTQSGDSGSGLAGLDIAGVEIRDAEIRYRDLQAGTEYVLDNVSLDTGRIGLGEAFDVKADFAFSAKPDNINGQLHVSSGANIAQDFSSLILADLVIDGDVNGIAAKSTEIGLAATRLHVDINGSRLEPTSFVLTGLGLTIDADLRSMSWADDLNADAGIRVAQFSLRELLTLLDIEPPETADPNALQKVAFSADAVLDASSLSLHKMNMQLDDTTLSGELSLPVGRDAPIRFDLAADRMDIDRYMAPATDADAGSSAAADDFEIPVDMIRGLNARGTLKLAEASLSGIRFTNLQLGLNVGGGKLQLKPLSAEL